MSETDLIIVDHLGSTGGNSSFFPSPKRFCKFLTSSISQTEKIIYVLSLKINPVFSSELLAQPGDAVAAGAEHAVPRVA